MKTFAIGDIHGCHKALLQCLERSKFDKEVDRLICLGDIVDGFPDTKKCIEELMTIKEYYACLGNHDFWAIQFFKEPTTTPNQLWVTQGGQATLDSYGGIMNIDVPKSHIEFLEKWNPYIIWDTTLFVHGGFDPSKSIEIQNLDNLIWNRQMVETAWKKTIRNQKYNFGPYDQVFVGHTPTTSLGIWDGNSIIERSPTVPLHLCNIWMLDTGAGWDGRLTMMNVETKEYFQSDPVLNLYPGMGRGLRF